MAVDPVRVHDDEVVIAALECMGAAVEGQQHAVVLGSYCAAGDVAPWLPHIERVTRQAVFTAVLRPGSSGEPFPDESSLLVITPDYAAAEVRADGGRQRRPACTTTTPIRHSPPPPSLSRVVKYLDW